MNNQKINGTITRSIRWGILSIDWGLSRSNNPDTSINNNTPERVSE